MKMKFSLVLTTLSLLAATAFAQTQNIPVPASSVNGGRAVVAITMPTIPPNYTVADINWIVNSGLNSGSIVAPRQPQQTVLPVFAYNIPGGYVGQGTNLWTVKGLCISGYAGYPAALNGYCPAGAGFFFIDAVCSNCSASGN